MTSVDFKGIVFSKHAMKSNSPQVRYVNDWEKVDLYDVNVVMNSWKSLDKESRSSKVEQLLEISKKALNLKKIVNLSSVAIYGECEREVDETTKPYPINQYGINKLEIEKVLKEMNFSGLFNLRLSNVFGHRNCRDVINKIIDSHSTSSPLTIDTPNLVFRDFISISRVIEVLVKLCENKMPLLAREGAMDLNVCSGESLSLSEIISIFNSLTNSELRFSVSDVNQQTILQSRVSNRKLLGLMSLTEGDSKSDILNYIRESLKK